MLLQMGRFQPFHLGHLAIAQKALAEYPNETLIIGVIMLNPPVNRHTSKEAAHLDQLAASRKGAQDNPWSVLARVRAIRKTVAQEIPNRRVEVIPVPRPETFWDFFTTLAPKNRIWVLPRESNKAYDEFEQAKYDLYKAMGDEVCEVTVDRVTSGTEVRRLLRDARHEEVRQKIPKSVLEELDTDIS